MLNKYSIQIALVGCAIATCSSLTADSGFQPLQEIGKTQITNESRFETLTSTPEGMILFWGWDDAEEHGFDSSILTEKDRELFIEKGLTDLAERIEQEDKNAIMYSNILARYYFFKNDRKKCLYWSFKGAENGCAGCMLIISDAYRRGDGVVQDIEESIKWKYLGAALGNEFCKKWVGENSVKGMLRNTTSHIFLEAKKRANQWMKDHSELFISAE